MLSKYKKGKIMNIEQLINDIQESDIQAMQEQVAKMESEEVAILGPMNMLAFDA